MSFGRLIRLAIMIALLILSICIGAAPEPVKADTMYTINFQNIDEGLIKKAVGTLYGTSGLETTSSADSDLILEINGEDRVGYENITVGYSPVVAIFPEKFENDMSENFHCYKGICGNYYMTNMKKLVDNVSDSEDGNINTKSLGYHTDLEVSLGIPDAGSPDRRAVVDSIIYLITDGRDVNEENVAEVKTKLNDILTKSKDIININSQTLSENKSYILLIPEYRLRAAKDYTNYPIYWEDSCAVSLNMQVKSSVKQEHKAEILKCFKESKEVFRNSWIRNDWAVDVSSYTSFADSVKVRYVQDNLEELLGNNYWK